MNPIRSFDYARDLLLKEATSARRRLTDSSPDPHPRMHAPEVHDAFLFLLRSGLVTRDTEAPVSHVYQATPRGVAWINMILQTPLPEARSAWADPRTGEIIEDD